MCLHVISALDIGKLVDNRGSRPICPFAAAICRRPFPPLGSTAPVRIVEGVDDELLAKRSMPAARSEVSPLRARYNRSSISSSDRDRRVAVGILDVTTSLEKQRFELLKRDCVSSIIK